MKVGNETHKVTALTYDSAGLFSPKYLMLQWKNALVYRLKSQLLYQLSYASTAVRRKLRRYILALSAGAGSMRPSGAQPAHFNGQISRDTVRCCRSSAIRSPRHSMTVITAEPPKLTSGSGTPTTGARPITIIRLIDT